MWGLAMSCSSVAGSRLSACPPMASAWPQARECPKARRLRGPGLAPMWPALAWPPHLTKRSDAVCAGCRCEADPTQRLSCAQLANATS